MRQLLAVTWTEHSHERDGEAEENAGEECQEHLRWVMVLLHAEMRSGALLTVAVVGAG
jgi:uncharacterized protein YgfB (UPF0149 family)